MSVFTAPEQMCQPKSMNFVRKMYVGTRIPSVEPHGLARGFSQCFYDNEGNIDNIDEDAPELLVGWGVWKVRSFYLSKKDLVALSKFMIKYYEIFIEEYKEVERQLNQ